MGRLIRQVSMRGPHDQEHPLQSPQPPAQVPKRGNRDEKRAERVESTRAGFFDVQPAWSAISSHGM